MTDIRHALRALAAAPTFSAAVVMCLAIGLTGAVLMVALVHGVLLSPLPVRAEAELLVGWRGRPEGGERRWPFSAADLDLLGREARTLSGVAGVGYNDPWPMLLADGPQSFVVRAARVTGDFFDVLGTAPLLGRPLGPADDRAGSAPVIVLAHRTWQSRFGGAADVVGRRITFAGRPFIVAGVMPPDVDHPRHVEVWVTVAGMQSTTSSAEARQTMASELYLVARRHPFASPTMASDELRRLGPALDARQPVSAVSGFVPQVESYRDAMIGNVRPALTVLLGAVGLVLLLACANVAGLFLVRNDARSGEFAVRAALGAGPARLSRPVVFEALLLAGLAGALALAASRVLLPALLTRVPNGLPRAEVVGIDGVVVAAGAGLAALAAALVAALPAIASGRTYLQLSMQGAGRAVSPRQHRGVRDALVAGQVALAVVGLVGVGLLLGSLQRLRHDATALATGHLVLAPLVMPQEKYEDRTRWRRFVTTLVEAVAADPRVMAVTPVNATPFAGTGWEVPTMTAEGQSDDDAQTNPSLNFEEVDPSYFRTLEVPLIRGRLFTTADRAGAPRVAIVTADVAARVWPGQDPIGKRLKWGRAASDAEWLTVVGIVAPSGYRDLRSPWPSLYVPAAQMLGAAHQLVVRTAMPVAQLADLLRARVAALDPAVELMPLRPFDDLLDEPLAGPRFYAWLMTAFGVTGVALAGVGLYGAMAARVRQLRREIGVRLALGAGTRDVRRLVAVDALRLVAGGIVCGLAIAAATTRTMGSLLHGVDPLDLRVLVAAVGVVVAVAVAALLPPLGRAGRVAPAEVLRSE